MSNIIFWAHQSTVDYTYLAGQNICQVASSIMEKEIFSPQYSELNAEISKIAIHGIPKDIKVDITKCESDDKVIAALDNLRAHLEKDYELHPSILIGGNPAISAMRGHLLRSGRGPNETDLPLSLYTGLFPTTVSEILESKAAELPQGTSEAFKVKIPINARPQTIGIETGRAKLMIIYGKGRSIADLAPHGDFSGYIKSLENVLAVNPRGLVVLALTIPPTPSLRDTVPTSDGTSEYDLSINLIKTIKKTSFGDRVRVFVSTRYIKEENIKDAQAILDFLKMKEIDIVSMNETEAIRLYTAFNDNTYRDIPLAYKVRELPFQSLKLCHSPSGVILDLGCIPERIITSKRFREDPAQFLEETLRLSADGATYAMDSMASLGRTSTEAMIRIYSKHVDEREDERFKVTFLNVDEPMPAGMIWESAAKVRHPMQAILGLGAIFDGLFLSFLMRD